LAGSKRRHLSAICSCGQEIRLVTLIGPGGVGKTRLALQVASDVLEAYPGGVFFIPLAAIDDADMVMSAVARTLRVKEGGSRPLLDLLRDALSMKRALFIMDNFEHVREAGPAIAALLTSCPKATMLVTSRALLRLSGEHEVSIPSLSLPDRTHLPDLESLSHFEAIRLFVERARAARPDFAVTGENAPAAARGIRLCKEGLAMYLSTEAGLWGIANALLDLAIATSLVGRHEDAAKLLGIEEEARRRAGLPLAESRRFEREGRIGALRKALGDEVFEELFKCATLVSDEQLRVEVELIARQT
jgi:predicted ATPase